MAGLLSSHEEVGCLSTRTGSGSPNTMWTSQPQMKKNNCLLHIANITIKRTKLLNTLPLCHKQLIAKKFWDRDLWSVVSIREGPYYIENIEFRLAVTWETFRNREGSVWDKCSPYREVRLSWRRNIPISQVSPSYSSKNKWYYFFCTFLIFFIFHAIKVLIIHYLLPFLEIQCAVSWDCHVY